MKRINRHLWLFEPLVENPACVVRTMFGTKACYYHGLLTLLLCDSEEPWRGVLVATERTAHADLLRLFPTLSPHPILPKWLYLPEDSPSFERDAQALVERVRQRDPLIGVVPEKDRPKKPKKKQAKKRS